MSKICVGIPSLGINPIFFDRKLIEHKESGIDFLIYVNYRDKSQVTQVPSKYCIGGFNVIQCTDDFVIGNFRARLEMMEKFLELDYDYLLTFDMDDKFIRLQEDLLLNELGSDEYVKFKFSNINIDSVEVTRDNYDELIHKKFVVGIHNCLMTKDLVRKLVNYLTRFKYEYLNFGEDILFTTMILNLINKYKVSSIETAVYDDSGASFTYGKSLKVGKSIIRLFDVIIPEFNSVLSGKFIEYLYLSNFSYILYEYYQRFKKNEGV